MLFYLRKTYVLRGGEGADWSNFSYFLVFGGVWKLVGTWKLLFWRLEGLEAGKWEAGGWTMCGQNKRTGGVRVVAAAVDGKQLLAD